jgi:formyltetrahydrofolate-dependent phosphoribosylglycinamide formyltransferase
MPKVSPNPPVKTAVLLSGSGRTLQNLLDHFARGLLSGSIAAVVSSKPGVLGLERAAQAGIPTHVVERKGKSTAEFSRLVTAALDKYSPELVLMAGWICLYEIPPQYAGKVMNIHPALLPSFGGKGMYGHHVHEAVLAAGVRVSGCTVHFADNEYDHGPIILQRACPVHGDDTAETLADRVFAQECIAYPSAVRLFAQRRLRIDGRRVKILPDKDGFLKQAAAVNED